MDIITYFIFPYLKILFIMTPFFILSVFLTVTKDSIEKDKHILAIKITISAIILSLILLFFGKYIFQIFGITLDAFKIGAGALLFLTAVKLVRGNIVHIQDKKGKSIFDLAIVPLTIPITIGPGTIVILLVMGAKFHLFFKLVTASLALVCAIGTIGMMLYFSNFLEKIIGKEGILVISKITGVIVAAIAAQIIFDGVKNFLGL